MEEMNDEFFEWLDNCPVQWFRTDVSDNEATYRFVQKEEEE